MKLNSTRIGGMAVTEAWKARDVSRPSSASAAKRHLTNGALISEPIQKRGAAKTHIPGDLTKPFYLKRALQNVYEELRILGALGYIKSFLFDLYIETSLALRGDSRSIRKHSVCPLI